MYATAPRVQTWVLLEQRRPWGESSFPDERLPLSVRQHLKHAVSTIPRSRPLLIRQRGSGHHKLAFFLMRTREHGAEGGAVWLNRHEDLLAWNPENPDSAKVEPSRPVYLVCTHGKHDQCCAKFGFATYCSLREDAGSAVWECTHVGGDRFAANVLYLPYGIYYGHVAPEETADLVAAHQAGRISLKHYRGRCCYGRTEQAGEYFVRQQSNLLGFDDLTLMGSEVAGENMWRVRFRGPEHYYQVSIRALERVDEARLTCRAVNSQPIRGFELLDYASGLPERLE